MSNAKEIKLPTLKPEDTWFAQIDDTNDAIKKMKRVLDLMEIAWATAVYAHENKLSREQKNHLISLFRMKADMAFEIIYEQVEITVGNSPSHRIDYLTDFESWQGRLIELLKEALDYCMDRETWDKELEALTPQNEPLCYENRPEWERRVMEHAQLMGNVFDKFVYRQKFLGFTDEAFKIFRRGFLMVGITMERPEWIHKALEKTGKLPEKLRNTRGKSDYSVTRNKQQEFFRIISYFLDKANKEKFNAFLEKLTSEKLTGTGSESKGKSKRGRKKDPKVRRRNKEIAKYRANNPKLSWKEIDIKFDVSADIARKACNNPDN